MLETLDKSGSIGGERNKVKSIPVFNGAAYPVEFYFRIPASAHFFYFIPHRASNKGRTCIVNDKAMRSVREILECTYIVHHESGIIGR